MAQTSKDYFIKIKQSQLFVKEFRNPNRSAIKIVFLHGGAGDNHLNFLPHCKALSKDFHLYFYDQTDAGQSYSEEKPTYSVALEVEHLEQLRQHWQIDKLNLVGHSWGSILALHYAHKYPQHVNKLLLTGAIGIEVRYLQLFGQNLQSRLSPEDQQNAQALMSAGATQQEYFEKVLVKHYFADSRKVQDMHRSKINFEVNQAIGQELFQNFDLNDALSKFTFPVLVLQGSEDVLRLEDIKAGFAQIPQVVFQEIPNAGHWAFVEQPEAFNEALSAFFAP